jgi:hypothetical protein
LLKSGVAVLTAGALVAGTAAVHPQTARRAHHRGPSRSADQRSPGTTGDLGTRAKQRAPGIGPSRAASPTSARDSAPATGLGGAGRAGTGGTSALFNRARRSGAERHLVASVAPPDQQPYREGPAFHDGSSGGKPQTGANAPSRGTVPETSADSPAGRSPGASDFPSVDNSSPSRGVPAGEASGGSRGSSQPGDWSNGGAGWPPPGSPDGRNPDAASANAVNAGAGSGEAGSAMRGSGAEGWSGGRDASGPTGYGSSTPDAAGAASGQSTNAGATPQRYD